MATGLTIASTVVSMAGQVYSGMNQAAAAKAQAKQAQLQGLADSLEARQEAVQLQQEAQQLRGKQVAQAAAAGLDLGSSSFISVQETTKKQAQEDIDALRSQGRLALATGDATASAYRNQASGYVWGSVLGAGSTALGGLYKVGQIEGWEGFDT